MRGAILAFSQTNTTFARFKKATTEIYKLPFCDSKMYVYLLPYTEEAFNALPDKQKEKLLIRIGRQLEQNGIVCVYPVPALLPYTAGNFYIPNGRRIFYAFAGQIIERHCKTAALSPENAKLYIYENPFTHFGKSAADFLALHTKQLTLVSPDTIGANYAAEKLFEEYGLTVHVSAREKLLNKADIALLLSPPQNQVLTNGLIMDFTGQYPHHARKDVFFDTAIGYAKFLKYFSDPNCRSAEFILLCNGLENETGLVYALQSIGWNEKA